MLSLKSSIDNVLLLDFLPASSSYSLKTNKISKTIVFGVVQFHLSNVEKKGERWEVDKFDVGNDMVWRLFYIYAVHHSIANALKM